MIDERRPYSPAPWWKTLTDMVEMKIGKLRPKVPIRNTMTRMTTMSGRLRTYRKPSTRPPRERWARSDRYSFSVRSVISDSSTAPKVAALMRNTQPGAHGGDQEARDGRPEKAGGVEGRRVEGDGVRQVGAGDEFGDEALTCRRVERCDDAERQGEQVDVPQLHGSADGEEAEPEPEKSHQPLGQHQQATPVEVVGRPARHWEEE